MPGIFGIIAKARHDDNSSALAAMAASMMYESFYRSGSYVDAKLGLSVGWVCHPGAFADCLPVWNEEKTVCLIITGETFEDSAVIQRLRKNGHVFEDGNASYLVHLFEESGSKFFEQLNGPFSGLLIDLREQKATLFNDRYGLCRLYFHENERGYYFSSEAKALLKILPACRQFDRTSLGEFLSCGSVLQNRTLFDGISLVPGAAAWTFSRDGDLSRGLYFNSQAWENQPVLEGDEYYRKLQSVWERILPRYFEGREKVGLSLTGGVDSRMILAWAPRGPGELPCYTWGGIYRDCADVTIARQLAAVCQQPHHTIPLDRSFLANFHTLASRAVFISDGAMDVTGSVDLHVQQIAREIATVRLSGVYGGEILRRLVIFKPTETRVDWLSEEVHPFVAKTAATYARELQGNRLSFIAFKQAPWAMTGKFAIERSQVAFRTPYFDHDLVSLAYQAPREYIDSNESSLRLVTSGNPALAGIETDRGLMPRKFPGLTQARHMLQQFTFKAEYAYDYGMPQWLAKVDRAFSFLHLEKLFLGRHKFHHFRIWYRDSLSQYLKDTLLNERALSRPYLRRDAVETIVSSHVNGTANHTLEIHKMLTLELIQRTLFEQN